MATKKRKRRSGKKKAAPARRTRKRRAGRRSMSNPKLHVTRGERIAGKKGFVWHGRYGSQHIGSVVATGKGKATKQLRAHAARVIRGR